MSTQCREIERAGADLRIFPVRTGSGSLLFVLRLSDGRQMEISSYLAANGCTGSVATNLRRRVAGLTRAANANPDQFQKYRRQGLSFAELLRI